MLGLHNSAVRQIGFLFRILLAVAALCYTAEADPNQSSSHAGGAPNDYISIKKMGDRLGMRSSWLEKGKRIKLSSNWTELEFTLHKRECLLNGLRLHLGFPVRSGPRSLEISSSDWENLIQALLTPAALGKLPPLRHVIIDAGHGGKDQGAHNKALGLIEKSLTLDLAKRLQKKLQDKGYTVSMTRVDDRFIPLEKRAQLANASGADLLLSLHFNAVANPDVQGIETFVFTPPNQPSTSRADIHPSDLKTYPGNKNGRASTLLGFYLHRSIEQALPGPDRGLKRARFTVLRDSEIPGVLIEGGFLSNDTEGRNVGSAAYRERLCDAIIDGLEVYQRSQNRSVQTK